MSRSLINLLTWLGQYKDGLTVLFAVIAGATTLHQYLQRVEEDRKKETIKLAERFNSDQVRDARRALAHFFLDPASRKEFDTLWPLVDNSPAEHAPKFNELITRSNLTSPLIVLQDFYVLVDTCVSSNVCSRQLACTYFSRPIRANYRAFRSLFEVTWEEIDGQNFMAKPYAFANDCMRPS